jgi:CDGSH-type Zn-finger protein
MREPRITIVRGGPMVVDGLPLGRLEHAGDAWRVEPVTTSSDAYAICRCARSSRMPLCDRSEPYACFDEQPASGPDPAPYRWDVPDRAGPRALALTPTGPGGVAGNAAIAYGDRELSPRDRVSLCRCGESRCQPLCDSSHKVVGYRG